MKDKLNYKIGVIVVIAFVAGIIGTLSLTSFDTQTENVIPQSNPSNQNVGIGAYVIVEAYHKDGTLYDSYEGHNALSSGARNTLASCITGIDLTPENNQRCDTLVNNLQLTMKNQTDNSFFRPNVTGTLTLLPNGCNPDAPGASDDCDGWEHTGTFDFDTLSCTENVDCFNVTSIASVNLESGTVRLFNFINLFSPNEIAIGPNDRLFVNMTFSVPP